jgi:hypothetical protein
MRGNSRHEREGGKRDARDRKQQRVRYST